jgi:transposase
MIAFPSEARVWLATGHTDMRKGFGSLALMVQEGFKRDPHAGDLWVFRGRRGDLVKLIWRWRVPVREAAGARAVRVAVRRRRGGDDLGRATDLSLVGHRLANAAENLASHSGRMTASD